MTVRRIVIAGAAALAGCGVLGIAPAVQASSASAPAWTKQAPAVHPPAQEFASMAYDAATRTVVLFGGAHRTASGQLGFSGNTWTWDGTTWTLQHPAVHPPGRDGAAMAYDAATGTVVLFGGTGRHVHRFGDTWTWDGTTWTRQHPATSPPSRNFASMAYDAATGTPVLFGGCGFGTFCAGFLHDTWTWDGTTWTQQAPATRPTSRGYASMAYDAATGTAVLFGGRTFPHVPGSVVDETWTWDGTTWTLQAPAVHPSAREFASMAYDAATGTVVLFGGENRFLPSGETWTWDGTTWTDQAPAASPTARYGAAMAYDAATGTAVLFGGVNSDGSRLFGDTWTWG